jgi:tRNA uracil 4-sulfurtransferase
MDKKVNLHKTYNQGKNISPMKTPPQHKAILLLSGGIDSPVAAYLMQKKGYDITALHFYNKHLSNINTIDKCKEVCKKLHIKKLMLIPFDQQQAEIVKRCNHRFYYVLQRRLMWRIAEKIAEQESASCLITGENLAQVASQTLTNMVSTQQAVSLPIVRPLLCNDKVETMKIAREIDTYDISTGPEVCCVLGPKNPVTSSRIDVVVQEESKLDSEKLSVESLQTVGIVEF